MQMIEPLPAARPVRSAGRRRAGLARGITIGRLLTVLALGFALVPTWAGSRPIAIKVAQYARQLEFSCNQGATFSLGGQSGSIAAGQRCTLRGVLTNAAANRYHVIVADIPIDEPTRVEATVASWQSVGWPTHTLTLGQRFYAEDGKTVVGDNRQVLVGIACTDDETEARRIASEIEARGETARVQIETLHRAQGTLTLSAGGQTLAVGDELSLAPVDLARLFKVEYAVGYPWHGFADRDYRGRLAFRFGIHDAIDCVLHADFDAVLAGIVPSEISANAQIGALQAQAVAARGEILAGLGLRHPGEGFDTCAEQHCQVYNGETAYTPGIARAIEPTRGQVLVKPTGKLVSAVYAANCGGHGEANHLVWTTNPDPILIGVWDIANPPALDLSEEEQVTRYIEQPPAAYCNDPSVEGGDKFRWTRTLTAAEWQSVETSLGIGRIKQVKDYARGFSGRIYQLTFVGERGSQTVKKELTIRKLLGSLRSSAFIANWKRDAAGFITGADLKGAGFGHGVGMCQTGAQALAKRGWAFDRILLHYFPGSELKLWY